MDESDRRRRCLSASQILPSDHPTLRAIVYNINVDRPVRGKLAVLREEMGVLDRALLRLANAGKLNTVAFAPLIRPHPWLKDIHRLPFEGDDAMCIRELLPQVAERGMLRFCAGQTDT